uniref:BtpA family membrane complex biogenesis protein n=1 Tax=Globodera pallida TaxID=36090 RepID=A0A183CIM1_GLOPA
MHDLPYQKGDAHGPEVCATMARLCAACAQTLGSQRRQQLLLGVQILAGANRAALAVAQAAEFDFVRVESFVFGHVADEGWMDGCAGELLRYRRTIGADQIAVVADVKKKHCSHAITADVSVAETARAAEFFQADGVILSGASTGEAACPRELNEVRSKCSLPVLIGSGIDVDNANLFGEAGAFIVGSHFKKDGNWRNVIERSRVQTLVEKVRKMDRQKHDNFC